jgi:hypothetical protein
MTATCQFCQQMIQGPALTDESSADRKQWAYRQVSLLVSAHMADAHPEEAGNEITAAMMYAGAAVAMRFVLSSNPVLDAERIAAGDRLVAAFAPVPVAPVVTLEG